MSPTDYAAITDGQERLAEVAVGYRTVLLRHGFSDEAAEAMIVQFHEHLLTQAFATVKPS